MTTTTTTFWWYLRLVDRMASDETYWLGLWWRRCLFDRHRSFVVCLIIIIIIISWFQWDIHITNKIFKFNHFDFDFDFFGFSLLLLYRSFTFTFACSVCLKPKILNFFFDVWWHQIIIRSLFLMLTASKKKLLVFFLFWKRNLGHFFSEMTLMMMIKKLLILFLVTKMVANENRNFDWNENSKKKFENLKWFLRIGSKIILAFFSISESKIFCLFFICFFFPKSLIFIIHFRKKVISLLSNFIIIIIK